MPPAIRRVLITGGLGFVGRHLRDHLLRTTPGLSVEVADRSAEGDLQLDLAQPNSIVAAVSVARPDVVFHLAGEASVAAAGAAAAETWHVNLGGSMTLARALADVNPAATVLFTSSSEVYGSAFLDGVVDETTRPAPGSVYAQSKLATEQMLAAVLPATASLIVVRPSNHIGPGQNIRFALPSFAAQLVEAERAGRPAHLRVGNLETTRDFMDVRDVVRAYAMLVQRFHGEGARELFNVASGTAHPVRFALDMLRGSAWTTSTVEIDPARFRPAETPFANIDASRLRAAIPWSPGCSLEQSARDVLDDWRTRLSDRP